ncbi:ubiquinol oxidase subunit II [Rahnella inusitata]|uniref:Ubiquinol oxidase subunit II n=1 Tax=Rahnella inusitata TaxID=58169 RepID=A0ABX9P0K5_9GAMM|nr:ubiquinol oxidase subunit II [Rahnella inusitata]THD52075.1 ubiquinol oxidase subunit II [Enterobacteriaceae bacterium ML5]
MMITLNTPVKTCLFEGKSLVSSLIRHLFSSYGNLHS